MFQNAKSLTDTLSGYLGSMPIQVILIFAIAIFLNTVVRIAISRFVKTAIARANERAPQYKRLADNTAELSAMVMQQRTVQRVKAVGQLFRSASAFVIWTVAIMSALSVVGFNVAPLLASAGVAGVALGFGAQTLIKDFLAGIFIILEDQYGVGDVVDLGPAIGTVEEVDLRVTRLRDMGGVVWYVRNGEILRVANRSQGWTVATVDVPVAYDEDLEKAVVKLLGDLPGNRVLIDHFLDRAEETESDSICDGEDVHIVGLMEHIEPAGIHSGDSSAVLPPFSLSDKVIADMENYSKKIAKALNVIGLLNIQFAVKDDKVYVIEANPRASRTVPFIAKAYDVPYINIAARVMLGVNKLKDFNIERKLKGFAIKEPVFSHNKFPEITKELGPEMKSTGEAIRFIKDLEDPYFLKLVKDKSMYLSK